MKEKYCWHPVAYAKNVSNQPMSVTLCSEPLVLWRDQSGCVKVLRDLCIHRGVALSLGKVCGDNIVCPYHGWQYDGGGKCRVIPQLEDQNKIPAKAKIKSYNVQEKYGLIWVSIEEPVYSVPEIPELINSNWHIVETGPFEWKSASARQLENFTDFAHFPFVHPGLLGDPDRAIVPPHEVRECGNLLQYEIVRPEAPNTEEFPVFANPNRAKPMRHNRYWLYLPYTIVLRIAWSGTNNAMLYLFVSQPITATTSRGYCIIAKNYGDKDEKILQEFEDVIFGQDQKIVESQRPEQVPFDLSAELHLKFDAVAVAYRRSMLKNGFAID